MYKVVCPATRNDPVISTSESREIGFDPLHLDDTIPVNADPSPTNEPENEPENIPFPDWAKDDVKAYEELVGVPFCQMPELYIKASPLTGPVIETSVKSSKLDIDTPPPLP